MSTNVTHNEAASRYELSVDDQLIGVADYRRNGDLLDFTHTEIAGAHEGRGLGTALVEGALDDVKRRSLMVIPHCWFMRDHIAEHPGEYLALVPAERRAQFGLPIA
jgi:predicted GNAT family acetyltransferase